MDSDLGNRFLTVVSLSRSRKNPRFIVPMTSTSCAAKRSARPMIELQLKLKFNETDEALPPLFWLWIVSVLGPCVD